MFNDHDQDLTESERTAFAELPRERAPSSLLEERVVRELRSRQFFRPGIARGGRRARVATRAAAAVVLFVAGAAADRLFFDRADGETPAITPAKVTNERVSPPQIEQWI